MIYPVNLFRSRPAGATWQISHSQIQTLVDQARLISSWAWKYSLWLYVRAGGLGCLALLRCLRLTSAGFLLVRLACISLTCHSSHTTLPLTAVMICCAGFGRLRNNPLYTPVGPPRNGPLWSNSGSTIPVLAMVVSFFPCQRNLR